MFARMLRDNRGAMFIMVVVVIAILLTVSTTVILMQSGDSKLIKLYGQKAWKNYQAAETMPPH